VTGTATAQELTVYRCVDAQGAVALQDRPCPPGQEDSRRRVDTEADTVATTAAIAPVDDGQPAPAEVRLPESPFSPPPALWLCVDFEGKRRYAPGEARNGRWVPAWAAISDGGLAGRGGRPAARGSARGPGLGPAASGVLGPMVWVEDSCRRLSDAAACQVYREQHEEARRRHFSRTGDERRQLASEIDRLGGILAIGCRN